MEYADIANAAIAPCPLLCISAIRHSECSIPCNSIAGLLDHTAGSNSHRWFELGANFDKDSYCACAKTNRGFQKSRLFLDLVTFVPLCYRNEIM